MPSVTLCAALCRYSPSHVQHILKSRTPGNAQQPAALYQSLLSTAGMTRSFFKNVDERHDPALLLPVGDGRTGVRTLKVRIGWQRSSAKTQPASWHVQGQQAVLLPWYATS